MFTESEDDAVRMTGKIGSIRRRLVCFGLLALTLPACAGSASARGVAAHPTTMTDQQPGAVFVNVVEVDPSRTQELTAIMSECVDSVIRRREGFISEMILSSGDGSRVINVELWTSADAVKALPADPAVAACVKRIGGVAKGATPAIYSIVAQYRH